MPIGLENKNSSFFTVESPDVQLNDIDFSKNLISLNITEKLGGLPQGSLSFFDPNHYFSKILRTGVRLIISWGYKNNLDSPEFLIEKKLNFDEITGDLIRRGYQGFVSSPTGDGGKDGRIKYNCNFSAFGFRGEQASKLYTTGSKSTVISQAMDDIGIIKKYIDFTLGGDRVTSDRYIRQDESTFAFLNRLAIEWQAFFHVAFSPDGNPVGIFIDKNKIGKTSLPAWVLNARGKSNVLGYKGELNNVISYKWSSNESESGIGSNVRLDIVDGQIQFRQYAAEEEKVITWRLNQKKVQEVFADASVDGLDSQIKLTQELLSKNDFEQIKRFFIPVEQSTAPDGYGYRLNCEMIGNPLFIPGNLAVINNGFPDRLGGKQSKWYMHSVNHKIDRSGYMMNTEIVDVFNLSPVGLPVL
jgi:hypothetical protein